MPYQLIRTRPSGVEKIQKPFKSARDAAGAAGQVLFHKGVSAGAAQWFIAQLRRTAIGEQVRHRATGYAFRI